MVFFRFFNALNAELLNYQVLVHFLGFGVYEKCVNIEYGFSMDGKKQNSKIGKIAIKII
jgi:hypothetical protein